MNTASEIRKKEGFSGQKAITIPDLIIDNLCLKNKIINSLYITDIGYYPKAKYHYRFRNEGAEQHILIYCAEGKGYVKLNNVNYLLLPGDVIIIPKGYPHLYASEDDAPWTIYWMHFLGNTADKIASKYIESNNFKRTIRANTQFIELFNTIYNNLERGYSLDTISYVNMCLWHFLALVSFNNKPDTDSITKSKIDTAIDFFKEHLNKTITVEEVSTAVSLSTSHFSALFKNKTGFSPIEYFNQLKIQKACQYLYFTDMKVKEIALKLGIVDQYYFSRLFSGIMGMSPIKYREKSMTESKINKTEIL